MKSFRKLLPVLIAAVFGLLVTKFDTLSQKWIIVVILSLFILHLLIRYQYRFKGYFTSKYNFMTNKASYTKEFDLSKDLLFHKLIEVIKDSGFRVIHSDETTGDIFAVTGISWHSMGENLYVSISEKNGTSTLKLTSACFFQVFELSGKHEENYQKLMYNFEESLII